MPSVNVCPGCFRPSQQGRVCETCAYNHVDKALPLSSVLRGGEYRIGGVLGRGGFGITYRAVSTRREGITLAVKEYFPLDFAQRLDGRLSIVSLPRCDMEFHFGRKKFLEEAERLRSLRVVSTGARHECLVAVYDSFEENGTGYQVMEFYGAGTAEDYFRAFPDNRVPFETAHRLLNPVADALRFVHDTNYLHRDVGPLNICLTENMRPKLIDFGSAKFSLKDHHASRSRSIVQTITPGYSAYEQYANIGHGRCTDVYSLGATYYRAVTGQVPPTAMDRNVTIHDLKLPDILKLPSEFGVRIPAYAELAIMKAMSLKCAERYQSVGELQDALIEPVTPSPKGAAPSRPVDLVPVSAPHPQPVPEPVPIPVPPPVVPQPLPRQGSPGKRFAMVFSGVLALASGVAGGIYVDRDAIAAFAFFGLAAVLFYWAYWIFVHYLKAPAQQ